MTVAAQLVDDRQQRQQQGHHDAQDADEGFVNGQRIELRLVNLAPDQIVRLDFRAQLNSSAPISWFVNTAQVNADNATSTQENSVVVVADSIRHRIRRTRRREHPFLEQGCSLCDQALTNLLPLRAEFGWSNAQNGNPFASDNLATSVSA